VSGGLFAEAAFFSRRAGLGRSLHRLFFAGGPDRCQTSLRRSLLAFLCRVKNREHVGSRNKSRAAHSTALSQPYEFELAIRFQRVVCRPREVEVRIALAGLRQSECYREIRWRCHMCREDATCAFAARLQHNPTFVRSRSLRTDRFSRFVRPRSK
jgi:hypothetical protein